MLLKKENGHNKVNDKGHLKVGFVRKIFTTLEKKEREKGLFFFLSVRFSLHVIVSDGGFSTLLNFISLYLLMPLCP